MYIMKSNKIGFIASSTKEAQEALLVLSKKYKNVAPDKADLIVALVLHQYYLASNQTNQRKTTTRDSFHLVR